MKKYDTVIIGGGPAGYAAALYTARAGLATAVLEMLSPGGQMATTSEIDNYPGFDETIDGFELAQKMQAGAERFGAESALEEVMEIDLNRQPKKITTFFDTYEADTVILAMGAAPRMLGIEHENDMRGRGISYCATCDGRIYKDRTVVVVGGGNTAAEDALYLSKMCKKVYLIHRRDTLRASAVYRDRLQNAPNIELVLDSEVIKLLFDDVIKGIEVINKVTHERTAIDCDGVFVAIGRLPNTALVKGQVELDSEGYIVADETTKTNIPGVFAAGDIRHKPLRQVVTAASDGAVASKFAEEFIDTLKNTGE